MISDLIKKISNRNLQNIATFLILLWIITPLVVMVLNALPIDTDYVYYIWATVPYFVGDIGWLIGIVFLIRLVSNLELSGKKITLSFLPLILLLIFGIWCFICDYNAEFRFVAFTCYLSMHDGFFMYFAYGGIILLGLILSSNKERLILLANTFLSVSFIQAIISLMNNGITDLLCRTHYTNTLGYESVFFNTNHYGYYLVFDVLIVAFLFVYANTRFQKIIYSIGYIVFIVTLVLNNTFGAYLAILLTLIFMLVWSAIIRDKDFKKFSFILLLIFILVSLATTLFVPNVYDNFYGIYNDVLCILGGEAISGEVIEEVGTGRGQLWKFFLIIAKQNPIYGIGGQNIFTSAHNMFLQITTYFGFVGLALYLLVLIAGVVRLVEKRKTLSYIQKATAYLVVAYLISGFFGVTMFYTAPYFYFILGICMSGALKEIDVNELQKVSV